jgi:hypothetical protein
MILGALGLAATLAETVRLFIRSGSASYAFPALAVWVMWAAGLVAPLAWAIRERRRTTPAPPDEIAKNYLVVGYGLAILALGVVEVCLSRSM